MSKGVIAVSALAGSAAFGNVLGLFLLRLQPGPNRRIAAPPSPTQAPQSTPFRESNPEIKAADVRSVEINTVYKGYFEPGNKCAKTYNEYFGNEDGIGSSSSPCTIKITADRDGGARRSIEISRWDKAIKGKRVVEKTESTAAITPEQFNSLAQSIVTNEAFIAWREGTMINVSNCSITVTHAGGTKSVTSNVDERTTAYLPMVEGLKSLKSSKLENCSVAWRKLAPDFYSRCSRVISFILWSSVNTTLQSDAPLAVVAR